MSSKPDRKSFPRRKPFPKFYPILDAGQLQARAWDISAFAKELRAAGVELLDDAAQICAVFAETNAELIFNDRADLVAPARFHGVHVGQQDMTPAAARAIVGGEAIIGVSTHTLEQVAAAEATDCDYIAYGPIFATASKANSDPVVGLEGLRNARRATCKPLVAIGGITLANCRAVMDAGGDSIAVISELFPRQDGLDAPTVRQIAESFRALLGS